MSRLPKPAGPVSPRTVGILAAVRDALRQQPEGRARVAVWALGQPRLRRAVLLALQAGVAGAVFGAVMADGGVRALNPLGAPTPDPLGAALEGAVRWSLGAACAGLTFAGVSAWLLAPQRARRWAAGAAVGLACMLGYVAARASGAALIWSMLLVLPVVLFALLGVCVVAPPAWSAAKAREELAARRNARAL